MPEEPYKNREVKEMFAAADDRADSFHEKLMQRMDVFESNTSTSLMSIETQTKKTNGSVAEINKWRERMNGGAIVLSFFMSVVVLPVLTWAIIVLVNLPQTINNSIQKALSVYDIQVK